MKDYKNKASVGQNAIWDGPLDLDALPKVKDLVQVNTEWKFLKHIADVILRKVLLLSELKQCNMTLGDFKLYTINTLALGVTTFTKIEMGLKILLLIVTIGYTMSKWFKLKKGK